MTRVAAIDCGTNSVRLLVADLGTDALVDVHRETRIVRLGQDVDRTGILAAEAIERTRHALADYAATISRAGAERVRLVATSATRDAGNRDDFTAMVHRELGVEPEVVTGLEEAALSYRGALGTLRDVGVPLLADIGGGSTEVVVGDPLRAHSMNIGSVRLTERHFADDPPTSAQIAAAESDVSSALESAARDVPLHRSPILVGVAGTVTTVAAVHLALSKYRPELIHGAVLERDEVEAVTGSLLGMRRAERAANRAIHPGRVDVIAAGALILRAVSRAADAERLVVSEHDILDGIALSLA